MNIGIICAMHKEVTNLEDKLLGCGYTKQTISDTLFERVEYSKKDKKIIVAISGVGMTNMAMQTTFMMLNYKI